jgi:hypothetical protein
MDHNFTKYLETTYMAQPYLASSLLYKNNVKHKIL